LIEQSQKIKSLRKFLVEAKAKQTNDFGVKKPKLLALLPTKTDVYLDLKTVSITTTADSVVYVHIDSIHFGEVDVMIDSSKHYNVASRSVEFRDETGGLYFEVFEQLQTGIQVIQKRVENKLGSNHLKQQALKKAHRYFKGLYGTFGYEVVVQYGPEKKSAAHQVTVVSKPKPKPETKPAQSPQKAATATTTKESTPMSEDKSEYISGIDVSHFNGDVDWSKVAGDDVKFAYAKATEGLTFVDPKFSENWKNISAANIKAGAYHFYVPTDDPVKQANFFIEKVGEIKSTDMPPMLDIEDTKMGTVSVEQFQKDVLTWMNTVEKHYGVQPILYTNTPFADKYLDNSEFAKYKLWIAEYTDAPQPRIPEVWSEKGWYIWQYTAHDKLNGVDGIVDADRMKNE